MCSFNDTDVNVGLLKVVMRSVSSLIPLSGDLPHHERAHKEVSIFHKESSIE